MKKKVRGQDTIEFVLLLPLVLLIFWGMIVMAGQWHSFHATSESALEAASKSGSNIANNTMKVNKTVSNQIDFANIGISYTEKAPNGASKTIGKVVDFNSDGIAKQFVGLPGGTKVAEPPTKGYVQTSQWKFEPCRSSCK